MSRISGHTSEPLPIGGGKKSSVGWKALLVGGFLVLVKNLKLLFVGLQFLKLGKVWLTALTMVGTIWAYAQSLGWPYSTGIVFLIFLHELGHGWAARHRNVEVGAPIFIPFVGAFIAMKQRPRSAYEDFFIGAGGPVVGITAALVCLFAAEYFSVETGKLLLAVGFSTLSINLFNLIPIGFLDGGRMTSPLGMWAWILGYPLLLLAAYGGLGSGDHFNPMVLMVLAGGAFRLLASFRAKDPDAVPEYETAVVTLEEQGIAAFTYFFLTGLSILLLHLLWGSFAR